MSSDQRTGERQQMVETQLRGRKVSDERVLAAMAEVPRHEFMPETAKEHAYEDRPLPIGHGQTISQPYVVASMTEALELAPHHTLLEIGTGSGYQAAVASRLCKRVVTIERIPELAESAKAALDRLGYTNVEVHLDDGTLGMPEDAPFDRILVTAAGPSVPRPLIDQLADPGILVMPVGDRYGQILQKLQKERGFVKYRTLYPCTFVPLIGQHGANT